MTALIRYSAGPRTSSSVGIQLIVAISEILLTAFVVLSMPSIVLYAPFWIFGGLIKRRPVERAMRLWPLVAVLSLRSSLHSMKIPTRARH
jgi:hypothetical protein